MNVKRMNNSADLSESVRARSSIITGILAGVVLNANFLAGAISTIIYIPNIFIILLVLAAMLSVVFNRFRIPLLKAHFIVVIVVSIQLLLGKILVNSPTSDRFALCFIGVGLSCLILTLHRMDIDALLKTIVISSLICIPYYMSLFSTTFTVYNSGNQMGIAYSILPGMIASIILFFYTKKVLLRIACLVVGISSLLVLFRLMTRGAYLCAFVFVLGYIYLYKEKNKSKKMIFVFLSILAVGVFVYLFGEKIMSSEWFYAIYGAKVGRVLNGRERDIEIALSWRGLDKFILGSGIGTFNKYEYTDYIHNLFGQLYYEQGIYSAIFVFCIITKAIMIILKRNEVVRICKVLLLMFFCVGIVRLMVSYYFWIDQYFWFFLWLILDNRYRSVIVSRDRKAGIVDVQN